MLLFYKVGNRIIVGKESNSIYYQSELSGIYYKRDGGKIYTSNGIVINQRIDLDKFKVVKALGEFECIGEHVLDRYELIESRTVIRIGANKKLIELSPYEEELSDDSYSSGNGYKSSFHCFVNEDEILACNANQWSIDGKKIVLVENFEGKCAVAVIDRDNKKIVLLGTQMRVKEIEFKEV